MTDILGALFGPLGGIIAGGAALVIALLFGRWQGRKRAQDRQERRQARDYRKTRKEIDNADLGIGSTDADRIDRLHDIARRRGGDRAD